MRITQWPHKLHRFGALSTADRWLLLRAVFWLGVARVQMVVTPFEEMATGNARETSADEADPELLRRIGFAVTTAGANVPWRSDCFPQTIAARAMLKRDGYASTIHLGVERIGDDTLSGHAWLTCGDTVVVGGADLGRYTEMLRP